MFSAKNDTLRIQLVHKQKNFFYMHLNAAENNLDIVEQCLGMNKAVQLPILEKGRSTMLN
ncbi:hypothetical protein H5410_003605 [Solanum commersonii]|uniref:Uncharacterized protein n=1 Tax=Solanum commersonii TaxID=4109 RepID=A0A9J6B5H1_SOLCO|nr:hypothetical protein H5410_003605 [Solanum commersonii]